jgi:tetratricopeptide (TPR) repeat protein
MVVNDPRQPEPRGPMDTARLRHLALAILLAALVLAPLAAPSQAAARLPGHAPARLPAAPPGQVDRNLIVEITSPQPGERLRGRVEIAGYAADLRSATGTGINERDIQIFLNDSSDTENLLDFGRGGQSSPAAASALGPQFRQAGFRTDWESCSFPEGPYTLIVWVSSLAAPGTLGFARVDVFVEPCPQGATLYQEDAPAQTTGIGALRIEQPEAVATLAPPLFRDFAAGVDGRCPRADSSCQYALAFRQVQGQSAPSGYLFALDPNRGTFTLGYLPFGGRVLIVVLPETPSPAIHRGTATNRLGVIAQGDWLRLWINGQQVADLRDDRRPWGRIGWGAIPPPAGRIQVGQFANFVVQTPGPAELLSALFPVGDSTGSAATPAGDLPAPGAAGLAPVPATAASTAPVQGAVAVSSTAPGSATPSRAASAGGAPDVPAPVAPLGTADSTASSSVAPAPSPAAVAGSPPEGAAPPAGVAPGSGESFNTRGVERGQRGDYQGALDDFTQALRVNPSYADAYNNRGYARYALGDLPGAIADYSQALRINPSYADAYNGCALARAGTGDRQGAVDDYTQVLRINPRHVEAYMNRGLARYALGDVQGAIEDYTQALRLNPNSVESYSNRAYARYWLGDMQGAIEDYTRALGLNPGYADAYNGRGLARYVQGDLQAAIDDYTQAILANPNAAEAYRNRATARKTLGDVAAAIQDLERAAAIFSGQGNTASYQNVEDEIQRLRQ